MSDPERFRNRRCATGHADYSYPVCIRPAEHEGHHEDMWGFRWGWQDTVLGRWAIFIGRRCPV